MSMELRSVLEALLFVSQKPLSTRELRDALMRAAEGEEVPDAARAWRKIPESEVETELAALAAEYESDRRSFRLICVAGSWQLVSRPEFAPWIRALVGVRPRPPRLSQPALETLAIIAYRQPITRAEIEEIRGVNVDGVMQTLLQRGLIQEVGRAETLGRPVTYGTTDQFLEYFGLRSLADLPAAEELRRWRPTGSGHGAEPATAPTAGALAVSQAPSVSTGPAISSDSSDAQALSDTPATTHAPDPAQPGPTEGLATPENGENPTSIRSSP